MSESGAAAASPARAASRAAARAAALVPRCEAPLYVTVWHCMCSVLL